jgi:hypothetical protein
MDDLFGVIDSVHHNIIEELRDNHRCFKDRLDEWKNGPNPYFREHHLDSVLAFVSKYLEWETKSGETRHWKHRMFGEIIPQDTDVFGPLLHFIGYHVYDDGSFSVKWFRDVYKTKEKEYEGKTYSFSTSEYLGREEVEPASCDKCYPVVVDDFYGTQNPQVIVDAMVLHERNQKKAQEEWERKVDEITACLDELRNPK